MLLLSDQNYRMYRYRNTEPFLRIVGWLYMFTLHGKDRKVTLDRHHAGSYVVAGIYFMSVIGILMMVAIVAVVMLSLLIRYCS